MKFEESMMSAALAYFPYDAMRVNQDKLIEAVASVSKSGGHLVVDGASGLGKTVAVLAGCLPWVIEGPRKLVYLARTHKQLDRVVEELKEINRKKNASGISLRGKLDMCINQMVLRSNVDSRTISELCEELKRNGKCPHYENIHANPSLYVSLVERISGEPFSAMEIMELGKSNGVCPYELARGALKNVKVVAASYLYIFDKEIRENFLGSLNAPLNLLITVFDEAHNLPEVCIEVESDAISDRVLDGAIKEADNYGKADYARFYNEVLNSLYGLKLFDSEKVIENSCRLILDLVERARVETKDLHLLIEEMLAFGDTVKKHKLARGKLPISYIRRVAEFLDRVVKTVGKDEFLHVVTEQETAEGKVSRSFQVVALDPRLACADVLNDVHASISLSGTISPVEAYINVIGLPNETRQLALASPFPKQNILAIATVGLSTVYRRRNMQMYAKLVEAISEVVEYTPANVGVFCPSYEIIESLLKSGLAGAVKKKLFVEKKFAKPFENDKVLSEFKESANRGGGVLLGVVGGRFSEGEDYPGDEMNSAVIVGVPYAKPSPKVRAQVEYYEKKFPGLGRELAYVIPAIRKAAQAAGRPFRSPSDKGAIILLDYRFATKYCRRYLPDWIRRKLRTIKYSRGKLAEELAIFFGK